MLRFSSLPGFFELDDSFSAFPSVTCKPSSMQLVIALNCLPAAMTSGGRVELSINSALLYVSYDYADVL